MSTSPYFFYQLALCTLINAFQYPWMASSGKDDSCLKRKLWSEESMSAAVCSVINDNKGKQLDCTTSPLHLHATGMVEHGCKPGGRRVPCSLPGSDGRYGVWIKSRCSYGDDLCNRG